MGMARKNATGLPIGLSERKREGNAIDPMNFQIDSLGFAWMLAFTVAMRKKNLPRGTRFVPFIVIRKYQSQ